MPNWYVVKIVDDEEMHIIPDLWLQEDKSKTAWPSYSSLQQLQNCIKDRQVPESNWSERDIAEILKSAGKNNNTY